MFVHLVEPCIQDCITQPLHEWNLTSKMTLPGLHAPCVHTALMITANVNATDEEHIMVAALAVKATSEDSVRPGEIKDDVSR